VRSTGSNQPSGIVNRVEPKENDKSPVVQKLREWDAQAVAEVIEFRGETTVVVPKEHLRRAAEYLAGEPSLRFSFLSDITTVDRYPLEPRFEMNYQLLSLDRRERLRLRVRLGGKDPALASVTPVWPTANWHERENFDLFGIRFEGHPNLTRILMPDDWEGNPLRKDYPVEGYR
jgi:NADH-quinone oxidoreductase subunit C